jgi:hypothetical protein
VTVAESAQNRYGFKYVKREYPNDVVYPEPKPLYVERPVAKPKVDAQYTGSD